MLSSQINTTLTGLQVGLFASSHPGLAQVIIATDESQVDELQVVESKEDKKDSNLVLTGKVLGDDLIEAVKPLGAAIESAVMAIVSLGITLKRLACLDGKGALLAFNLTLINLKDAIVNAVVFPFKVALLPFFLLAQAYLIAGTGEEARSITENFDFEVLNQGYKYASERGIESSQDEMYAKHRLPPMTTRSISRPLSMSDLMPDVNGDDDDMEVPPVVELAKDSTTSRVNGDDDDIEVPPVVELAKDSTTSRILPTFGIALVDTGSEIVKPVAMAVEATLASLAGIFSMVLFDVFDDEETNTKYPAQSIDRSSGNETRWDQISKNVSTFRDEIGKGNAHASLTLPTRRRDSTLISRMQRNSIIPDDRQTDLNSKPSSESTETKRSLVKFTLAHLNKVAEGIGATIANIALSPFTLIAQTLSLLSNERGQAVASRQLVYVLPIHQYQHQKLKEDDQHNSTVIA